MGELTQDQRKDSDLVYYKCISYAEWLYNFFFFLEISSHSLTLFFEYPPLNSCVYKHPKEILFAFPVYNILYDYILSHYILYSPFIPPSNNVSPEQNITVQQFITNHFCHLSFYCFNTFILLYFCSLRSSRMQNSLFLVPVSILC